MKKPTPEPAIAVRKITMQNCKIARVINLERFSLLAFAASGDGGGKTPAFGGLAGRFCGTTRLETRFSIVKILKASSPAVRVPLTNGKSIKPVFDSSSHHGQACRS